jgi:hypothetical protein
VKLSYPPLALVLSVVLTMAWCGGAYAAAGPKDKEKEHEGTKIDAGSFGIYQKGNRVGTETFSIYQTGSGSVIESDFKANSSPPAEQTSVMQLTANGEIRRYEWKEISPGSAESVVVPNDDFLNQKWRTGATEKQHEKPYLMPASTTILDDYFFIQREVLAWKFLAMACSKQEKGMVQCPPKQRNQFATLNPHEQASAAFTMESLGREKITLQNGQQEELNKLELKNDAGVWLLWLDDQWKVIRMSVVGENTEVDRD